MTPLLVGLGVAASGALAARALAVRGRGAVLARVTPGAEAVRPRIRLGSAAVAGMGLLAAVVGFRLAGPVGAAGGLGAALLVPRIRARILEQRRLASLEEGTAEVAAVLASAARAGRSIRRSLEEASLEAPDAVRPVLERAVSGLAMGQTLDRALERIRRGLEVPEGHLLVSVLEIHRRTGGDLPAALDRVADLVRGRVHARRRLRALSAQGRASGAVLAVLPAGFVGLLSGTGGSGLGDFYRTPGGSLLLLAGLGLTAAGFAWIRWILRRAEP